MQISFEKFTLPNGLDVILHQDRSLPLVSVNVWYHVGSKDEEPGKTGFAHLFEHLMFEGSKNHNKSFFEPLQAVGASLNGSTNLDRTNYWENLPSQHLGLALWLESDRMGFLLEALDQRRLDLQRDVVKNERRQSYENRPYGMSEIAIQEATYPAPHPYHWPTIGFHEDLDGATLEDVKAFFRKYYGPSNASLALAGDLELEEARGLVERYFADLPSANVPPRIAAKATGLTSSTSLTLHDKVFLPRSTIVWPTVPRFHHDEAALSVLATILGDGRSARLYRDMVYERRIAHSVSVSNSSAEIAGEFRIDVTAAAGHTAREVEEVALAEIEKLEKHPLTPEELTRAKNRFEAASIRQMQSIGGFGGRANRLNSFNVFAGDPDLINRDIQRFLSVQPEDIRMVTSKYLKDIRVQMAVLPEPPKRLPITPVDRTIQPAPTQTKGFKAPVPQRTKLPNGLEVFVIEKRALPVVSMGLVVKEGAANDPTGLPGLAAFTTAMLQEGTATRSSNQIADDFEFMGSRLSAGTGREESILSTETLTKHWPTALELMSEIIRVPSFPEQELERIRKERLTGLQRQRDDAGALAGRVAPLLAYGSDSPYGHPASGTEASLKNAKRDDLMGFFRNNYRPEDIALLVVGDVSMDEVAQRARRYLGDWQSPADKRIAAANNTSRTPNSAAIYLLDKPGAAQSLIRVVTPGVSRSHPDYWPLLLLNHVFGGQFTARLNMNLRQDKGYSYGYRSSIDWYKPSSLISAGGSVQTTVTREAILETIKEFKELQESRPVTQKEFVAAKDAILQEYPSGFETPSGILEQVMEIVAFDLPNDYLQIFPEKISSVSLEDVRGVAKRWLDMQELSWLVVGDRKAIESGLQSIGLPLHSIDYDGTVGRD
ncbi:MAG: insulinase family protein [Dehalococcoidia bacterium]|nr:insulinase family protein [Dehalococcoidia bacterium]